MQLPDSVLAHLVEVLAAPELTGGRYRPVRVLGRGGMGTVWLAEDTTLRRMVALKITSLAPASIDALRREVEALATLEHAGIVPVHDAGELPDGRAFYVMKYVRGTRLDEWAAQVDHRSRLRLFVRVVETIAFAHARGVLHLDLKPQNVMVGEFGEALVMDWGLSKLVSEGGAPRVRAGTPRFMSPEQASGDVTSAASDVFSLGAVLETLVAEAERSPALSAVITKATAPRREDRYSTVAELGAEVTRLLEGEPVMARRERWWERARRFGRRNRVILSLVAAYLVVRVLIALWK